MALLLLMTMLMAMLAATMLAGRMKRGLLYACCREQGYNKLVLAQHLDDLAESFIMSALHNGQVRVGAEGRCGGVRQGSPTTIRKTCFCYLHMST